MSSQSKLGALSQLESTSGAGAAPTRDFTSGGAKVKAGIVLEGVRSEMSWNGEAARGDIRMNTYAGDATEIGMGIVILHELGHNMGQSYGGSTSHPTYGRSAGLKIDGIDFPDAFPTSDYYDTQISGHLGLHCAAGLSGAQKQEGIDTNVFPANGTCIMFGAADMRSSAKKFFCATCQDYIKAEKLTDIRRRW